MKLNRIISKFFALAAAILVVAACSEDPTEDITGSGKPTPPVGDGAAYFNFEVESDKQIDDYEYVAAIGETIKFSDLSEATLSHEWQLSSVEGMEFMLADGSAVDPASVDISFDDEVIVRFTQAGEYTITLVNRYSENVTYTYPPEPSGSPQSVNGTEIGESGYYQMEWSVDVLVYSEEYSSLSASFFSNSTYATSVEIPWSPEERSLYIKDTTPYSKDAERPTKYTWICTSHSYDDEAGTVDPMVTFSDQDDDAGTVKVLFNYATEDVHIRMIVERDAGGEESGWLPAIAATNYNGLPYVEVGELDKSDLIISSITPYDPDGVGTTNQIELTLDSSNSGIFDSEILRASNGYSNFRLNYYDNTNSATGSELTGTAWSISTSKSVIVTLSGSIYTNDSNIYVTLSESIADIDLYEERDLTVADVATAGTNIPYERYNLFIPEYFDFNTMSVETLSTYWSYWNGTSTIDASYYTLSLVTDPHGGSDMALQVTTNNNTSVGGHKALKNSYPITTTAGTYNMSYKFTTTSTPDLVCNNTTTNFTLNLISAISNYNSTEFVGGSNNSQQNSNSGLPWIGVTTSNTLDYPSSTIAYDDWQLVEKTNITGSALTDYYLSLWWEYSKQGSFYLKDFKLEIVNDRP